jgi:hypothetical protein
MASYVDHALIEGESVTYTGHISLWSLMVAQDAAMSGRAA